MIKKSVPLLFLLIFAFAGCVRKNAPLELEPLALEDLDPRTKWAVISDPYVASRKEPSYESDVTKSLRKGELYKISGFCTVKTGEKKEERTEKWYLLDGGWVPDYAIKIFSNRLKAEQSLKSAK